MRYVIIGGVAAGMSAAAKLRREDPAAAIVVYEKGDQVSYGACGLPYFIAGYNTDWRKMIARTAEQFRETGIEVNLRHEVVRVMPDEKCLLVRNHLSGDLFTTSYDRLLIATGAAPIVPPIPGIDLPGIMTLKNIPDSIAIKEEAVRPEIRRVAVIGGGYIGIELLEAMKALGKEVRCIEAAPTILAPFETEISSQAVAEIRKQGIDLHLDEKVVSFGGTDRVSHVVTSRGEYPADLVILSIGVRPATAFLKGSGIALAANGAIIVDREMRTNIPDIYAAGDCAEIYHRVMEENAFLPLGTNANKAGRLVAGNLLGQHRKYIGTLGSAAIKVFELEMARTGLSERDCQRLGIAFGSTVVKVNDHPAYYPNPQPMQIKLIYEKNSRKLLGAHAAGTAGVVLRIDIFALAIHAGLTADELGQVDFCYAPPFAGVWDAVNVAANAVK